MSLFSGTPQQAPSYTTSTSETPKWMQDAIYNQIQWAQNVANAPMQQYALPRVAELSPLQQQAYTNVQANQGAWAPGMQAAQAGTMAAAAAPGGREYASPFVERGLAVNPLERASPYFQAQERTVSASDYDAGTQTLQPYAQQATAMSGLGAASPYLDSAFAGMQAAGAVNTSNELKQSQGEYLRPELVSQALNAGQQAYGRSAGMDATAAARPYIERAAQQDIVGAAAPYMQQAGSATAQALADRALAAADPYLQSAARSSAGLAGEYMSPYQQAVISQIAKQGARNLSENLLPAVSDAFIRAGQFGSGRMGEFGARALRDTQEAVLREQAGALQQGYTQAQAAAQQDLARQAQLAGTVGSISGADLSRILQGGGQYANLGQTAGQLTAQQASTLANLGQTSGQLSAQQMANLTNLGQAQTAAGQAQQQFGLNAAQAVQAAQAADAARQLQAAQAQAQLGQIAGGLTQAQQGTLLQAGQALSGAEQQANAQRLQAASQYGAMGQGVGSLAQGQQQAYLNAGQQLGSLANADIARQLAAYNQAAGLSQQAQGLRASDVAGLEAAGQAQQLQKQRGLDAAYQQFQEQQAYPKQQLDWLSTQVRGMAPITPQTTTQQGYTTQFAPSPLSQLASGLFAYKGLAGGG